MDEREALAALAELPDLPRIERHAVQPGDVIVIVFPGPISQAMVDAISTHCEQIWPNNKVAVFGDGPDVKVMAGGEVMSDERP